MRVLITGGYGFIGAGSSATCSPAATRSGSTTSRKTPARLRLILPEDRGPTGRVRPGRRDRLAALRSAIATHADHAHHPPRRLAGADVPGRPDARGEGERPRHARGLRGGEGRRRRRCKRLVYASSAAVFGRPDKYPAGPLGRRRAARARPRTTASSSAATRATPASTSRTTASRQHRPAAVDRLRRRPRLRHDQRADQGDQGACCSAGRTTSASAAGRTSSTSTTWPRCSSAASSGRTPGAKSYNLRGDVVDLPTSTRRSVEVLPAAAKLVTFGETQIAIAYDLSDAGARSATSARCRRRRWRRASARRWRCSGSCRRKAGSTRPISTPRRPPPVTVADEP